MYKKILKENSKWADDVWNKIDAKMCVTAPMSADKIPYTTVNGIHDDCAHEGGSRYNAAWWTNGFWPGYMWLMYSGTGNSMYREIAEKAEKLLDKAYQIYDDLNHDVGFMWHISSGVNYRLTGNKESRTRAALAADILMSRYNPDGRFISAWNGARNKNWVIIDSMMNIPILYWASDEFGDDRFKRAAIHHADTLLKTHIRADGTAHHIVRLDPDTGDAVEAFGGQGYCLGSSWTRGQAWAIYGYVLSYIHTGETRYLDAAKRGANAFIACACVRDWVIPIDFRQPEEPELLDSSASAIAACGLIEIAKNCPDSEVRAYLTSALRLLKKLDEKFCDYGTEEQSLLQMCSEAYDTERENRLHLPIIYGDYFFCEAIYKLKGFEPLFW